MAPQQIFIVEHAWLRNELDGFGIAIDTQTPVLYVVMRAGDNLLQCCEVEPYPGFGTGNSAICAGDGSGDGLLKLAGGEGESG